MAETNDHALSQEEVPTPKHSRRKILSLITASSLAAVVGPLVVAAFNFLRPRAGEVGAVGAGDSGGGWFAVARLSDVSGEGPHRREVQIEHKAGWTSGVRAHAVYVLPGAERRVVSAVCPHEGCEVEWSAERREFQCPCHDSNFSPEGARLGGPAQSGLARLTTRISGDVLEIHYADAADSPAPHETSPEA